MIRDYLKRVFALSPTEEERLRFLGPIGRWFLKGSKGISSDERYLVMLALITMYRASLPFGILLLVFFNYLAAKGLDANAYTAVLFSTDPYMKSVGIVGLYFYYYAQVMGLSVLTIACMCFALFLIHVKRGETFPLRADPVLKFKEKRTFKNLTKTFVLDVVGGIICYYGFVKGVYGIAYLSLIEGFLHNLSPAGILLWEIVSGALGILCQSFGAAMLYAASMFGWSIIFRYDKAYDELQKI